METKEIENKIYTSEKKRRCACCEQLLSIEEFDRRGSKIRIVCKRCKNIAKQGTNIKSYTIPQLLRELRDRGVKGKFTYTRVETLEI